MITDWRRHWGQGDFPFLIVQLANYYPEQALPNESTWAELRASQMAALTLTNTALATAIDIGNGEDIHPKNKQDLGNRLGLAALKLAYKKEVVHSGPVFQNMKKKGDKCYITFSSIGNGLMSKDKYGYIRGFCHC